VLLLRDVVPAARARGRGLPAAGACMPAAGPRLRPLHDGARYVRHTGAGDALYAATAIVIRP
jgi:hypothetical protein